MAAVAQRTKTSQEERKEQMRPIDVLGMGPKYEEIKTERGWTIKVTPPAWPGVGGGASVELTDDQYRRYKLWKNEGVLIQNALPELSANRREILMTGLDDAAFKAATREDDDGQDKA